MLRGSSSMYFVDIERDRKAMDASTSNGKRRNRVRSKRTNFGLNFESEVVHFGIRNGEKQAQGVDLQQNLMQMDRSNSSSWKTQNRDSFLGPNKICIIVSQNLTSSTYSFNDRAHNSKQRRCTSILYSVSGVWHILILVIALNRLYSCEGWQPGGIFI